MDGLLTFLPEGISVVSVIAVVMLFLKYMNEAEKRAVNSQKMFQDQVGDIVSDYKDVVTDNTKAMYGLKARINELVR